MLCQQCGDRQATVQWTQIQNDSVVTLHLCDTCAQDKGIESGAQLLEAGEGVASIGKGVGAGIPLDTPAATCQNCGMTLMEFRDLGRLGCQRCYDAFEQPLRELLRRLHGSTTHVGERYRPPGAAGEDHSLESEELRRRLDRAVASENFELAAQLRDRLRELE